MKIIKEHKIKVILAIVILSLIALFFAFNLQQYLQLDFLKEQQQAIADYYELHPIGFPLLFFLTYVLVAALSIPGATIFTLASGALFGLGAGTLFVSFASAIGATFAFLISRFLLKSLIHDRHKDKLAVIDKGIERDGGYYLFTIRLVPVFPYFLVNLIMGITTIRTWTFYWVSQLGMLPATVVYVNAGKQLGELDSLSGILSPDLVFAFILLGVFPLATKTIIKWIDARRKTAESE